MAVASRYTLDRVTERPQAAALARRYRYTAREAIDLIKIRTLAEAGVPLARIRDLNQTTPEEFERSIREADRDLSDRTRGL